MRLDPLPADLGLSSPAIGPWWSQAALELPAPGADLAIALPSQAGLDWMAPATGTLSLFVSTETRPRGLAMLRGADGMPAFAENRLIALLQLLPEVEARLHALSGHLPVAEAGRANGDKLPSRARVRWLAVELPTENPTLAALQSWVDEVPDAATVGLIETNGHLDNGAVPMADLKRPGDVLLHMPAAGARLWAFDAGGRPVDAGAVARWWSYLATTMFEGTLWAASLRADQKRTSAVVAGRTIHLVNAHEGSASSPSSEPMLSGLTFQATTEIGPVVRAQSGTSQVVITAPAPSDAVPLGRVAALPLGAYTGAATLWAPTASVPIFPLERDFVRVSLVDVEHHLVGQRRIAPSNASDAEVRRAQMQQKVSTRVRCERTTAPATLLATTEDATRAIAATVLGGGARLVASVVDVDAGALDAPSLPDVEPVEPTGITAVALAGGGTAVNGVAVGQRVLIDVDLPQALVGAWVRVWPQALDPGTARRVLLVGGSGRARAVTGGARASVVVAIPDGDVAAAAPLGIDLVVATARRSRRFADRRFDRPSPVDGAAVAFDSIAGDILVCEAGTIATPASIVVPSGATLVAVGAPPALVAPTSIPLARFAPGTLASRLGAGDVVELTEPAFPTTPAGDIEERLALTGATVRRKGRAGADIDLTASGSPLPTLERLEVAAAHTAGGAAAAVGATPLLARYHELLPHQHGHPGAPAAVDVHGTGVALTGRAAVSVAEILRDRTERSTVALFTAAVDPLPEPAEPTGATRWAAPLRTVAVGIEGESALLRGLVDAAALYVFGSTAPEIAAWLTSIGQQVTLPATTAAQAASIVRALDRRILHATRGAQEGATSLVRAIRDAEDLIYIETPALDTRRLGNPGEEIALVEELGKRLGVNRALSVVLCVPVQAMPGTPRRLREVRDGLLVEAIGQLCNTFVGRVAVFSPGASAGRTLRLASTTVIVDDVYAMTGTTHLGRRGLGFDSSLAVAVFDDALDDGRPREIRAFRRSLIAGRLGLDPALVPDDPAALCAAIRSLVASGGGGRLAHASIEPPARPIGDPDLELWNRNGAATPIDANIVGWLNDIAAMLTQAMAEEDGPPPP